MESEGYFLGGGGNGIAALGIFTAALFSSKKESGQDLPV